MELRVYNREGFKDFVDLDLDYFIELLIKEQKYLKCGRGLGINNILSRCISLASNKYTVFGAKFSNGFKLELDNYE